MSENFVNKDKYVEIGFGDEYNMWFDQEKREYIFINESSVLRGRLDINPHDNRDLMTSGYDNMLSQYKSFMEGKDVSDTYTEYVAVDQKDNSKEDNSSETLSDIIFTKDEDKEPVERERDVINGIDHIEFDNEYITIMLTMTDGEKIPLEGEFQSIGVKEKYRSDTGTTECKECGNIIDVECKYSLESEAYCEDCGIKYIQERENLKEEDSREFYCNDCERHHQRTIPVGDWKEVEPSVWGREAHGVNCYCGNTIDGYDLEPNKPVECRCGRTIEVSISEK